MIAASDRHRCVVLTGPRGRGKSTLAPALSQRCSTADAQSDGGVAAIAFCSRGTTSAALAAALAGQLTDRLPGSAMAARAYEATLDAAEQQGLPALQRRVIGPLARLSPSAPVRLIIDAIDELPDATQHAVRDVVVSTLATPGAGAEHHDAVRFVLTARPAASGRPPCARRSAAKRATVSPSRPSVANSTRRRSMSAKMLT